jgi:hypothetical protein
VSWHCSDGEDSTKYVKLLHSIFDQSQVFREWLDVLESPPLEADASTPGGGAAASASESTPPSAWANRAAIEDHLARISAFFYTILCNLTIRDLKSLMKRSLKHGVASFLK